MDKTYYKQIVGSLMYLTATQPDMMFVVSLMYLTATQPDMMFVVSLISRYMENPTELHLQAAKRVLRYLKGTTGFGIFYKKGGDDELVAYTDSDYAGDLEDRESTSGCVFIEFRSSILVIKKTTNSKSIYHRGRVYCCNFVCMPSSMVEKGVRKTGSKSKQVNHYLL